MTFMSTLMTSLYNTGLCFLLILIPLSVNSQHLFGNPGCSAWQQLSSIDKTTWLNAYLVPLNLTDVSRKKPKVDKFSQLKSLDTALVFVDNFCISNNADSAAAGAIRFLNELTSEYQTNWSSSVPLNDSTALYAVSTTQDTKQRAIFVFRDY